LTFDIGPWIYHLVFSFNIWLETKLYNAYTRMHEQLVVQQQPERDKEMITEIVGEGRGAPGQGEGGEVPSPRDE
jgi:hypothetical protein